MTDFRGCLTAAAAAAKPSTTNLGRLGPIPQSNDEFTTPVAHRIGQAHFDQEVISGTGRPYDSTVLHDSDSGAVHLRTSPANQLQFPSDLWTP